MARRTNNLTNLARLRDILCSLEPTLNETQISAAIKAAVRDPGQLGRAIKGLAANPKMLLDKHAAAAPIHSSLVDELLARGGQRVVRAQCGICEQPKKLEYSRGERRVCRSCYKRELKDVCNRCHVFRCVAIRVGGKPICHVCYSQDPLRHETCKKCGTLARVAARTSGKPICDRCLERPKHICSRCGLCEPAQRTKPNVLCSRCYNVVVMGRPPVALIRERHRALRRRTCTGCQQERLCADYLTQQPKCVECLGRTKKVCVSCGRSRPPHAVWKIGPICLSCYSGKQGTCGKCAAKVHVVKFGPSWLCYSCAGRTTATPCNKCDSIDRIYDRGTCIRCVLAHKIESLLADSHGRIAQAFLPLRDLLLAHPVPETIIGWLRKSNRGTNLLQQLVLHEVELSHEGLDRLGQSRARDFIRSLLISAGILPSRSHQFALLSPWLTRFLERHSRNRQVLFAFAEWHVFRRLRRKSEHEDISESSNRWARRQLRAAAEFLEHLHTKQLTLATCSQSELEKWLTSGSGSRYVVRDFLQWANRRSRTLYLEVPRRRRTTEIEQIDDEQRFAIIRRLINGDITQVDLRLGGALNQLFGQHVSRIVRLTDRHVKEIDSEICLLLGTESVPLPPPFDSLVRTLVETRRNQRKARLSSGPVLLFPGKSYGKPTTVDGFVKRLNAIGIDARRGRNASLMHLAATMPAPVLSDLLGIHIATAVRWNKAAGHSYARYVGRLKKQRDANKPPRQTMS